MHYTFDLSKLIDFESRDYKISHINDLKDLPFDTFEKAIKESENDFLNQIDVLEGEIDLISSQLKKTGESAVKDSNVEDYLQIYENSEEIELINEYLISLMEMKIIYIFKNLENNIKTIIKFGYPNLNFKSFHVWESINQFFKNVGINISEIEGFNEIDDLRRLNNNIKHSNIINEEIIKIREFASSEIFTFENLTSFYDRVKPKIIEFYKKLSEKVIENLFVFDDKRLDEISEEYVKRMDKLTYDKFIEKLKEKNT